MKMSLDELLDFMVAQGGSDLHVIGGDPPRMRRYSELVSFENEPISSQDVEEMLSGIMAPRLREIFNHNDSVDFAYSREVGDRFRVNIFRHLRGMGGVFRVIPTKTATLEELGLPGILANICMQKQGLILVTGKTGSGKSTTLAAMVDSINERLKGHIITIEDPVEFVHERKKCLISQREVGDHTRSFSSALRSALREDPDIILVGEMRDLETVGLAVTAAETGILVMGTLHTNSAAATVDRIVNTFPVEKQPHIRAMLSTSLRGVVSQQLIPRADGEGQLAAIEILINTPAMANIVREGKTDQIQTVIQGGALLGMQSMDNAIRKLLDQKLISGVDAYEAAQVKSEFERYLPDQAGNAHPSGLARA